MQRKKASDFDPRILELFDGYVHGKLSKRAFLEQAGDYGDYEAAMARKLRREIGFAVIGFRESAKGDEG